MSNPIFSSEIPKPVGSTEKLANQVNRAFALPIPAFGDLGKAANDLINKDFYHTSQATLDVKLKAPNGTNVTVKGKQGFDGVTSGSLEGKHSLKPQGTQNSLTPSSTPAQTSSSNNVSNSTSTSTSKSKSKSKSKRPHRFLRSMTFYTRFPSPIRTQLYLYCYAIPHAQGIESVSLTLRHATGVTITQAWATNSLLDTKVELADIVAPGAKIDLQNLWNPSKPNSAAQKITMAFKNPNVHSRAFINYGQANGNIDAVVDFVVGHEGFLAGGEAAYDVQKAAVTRYGLGLSYQTPSYTASVHGIQNLSIIAASYYQKVNSSVEVGAKAGYDVQASKASGLELASKYKLDPFSFAKAKINDRGIAALAYSTKLNAGTTLGLGLSLDTQKLNEAGHKIGTSLTFEG